MEELKLKRIEEIIAGVIDGTLEHQQSHYVCGSARCIAGWAIELFGTKQDKEVLHDEIIRIEVAKIAQQILGLSDSEAYLMFEGDATKYLHEAMLNSFHLGKRLELSDIAMDSLVIWKEEDETYQNAGIMVELSDKWGDNLEEDRQKIETFFGKQLGIDYDWSYDWSKK